jgi:FKBP-type peptidyl-prolyl cis-trans isomerase
MNLLIKTMAGAALATGAVAIAQMDMSSLPPAPGEMRQTLASVQNSLTECVQIAEEKTGGVAAKAEMMASASPAKAMITTFSSSARHEVTVNAENGEIMQHDTYSRFPGWDIPEDAEMQKTDSGLMYYVIEKGDGKTPAGPSSTVKVNYAGFLVDGTKFDSSFDRGQPIEFPLNRVIAGWTEGVGMMQEGGKWKLIIPSDLGYGARGAGGGRIPPNAMLVFDVELIEVMSAAVDPSE